LICHFKLDAKTIEQRFNIDFKEYFENELTSLTPMINDGLITLTNQSIEVQPQGRMLIRNICMQFDDYFQRQKEQPLYSKVI
jgi:oxygen-independent coproporphyrinogen-3 oxidase